jgi:hypothetical protein
LQFPARATSSMENEVRSDTAGKIESIDANELLQRGQ